MVHDHDKTTHVCELCGGEADLIIKEEKAEDKTQETPKRGTLVCKVCGSEADTIYEEI
jgi:rRNA maturation endonuclease Nob1